MSYDLSNAVGNPFFNLFKEKAADGIVTESSPCAIPWSRYRDDWDGPAQRSPHKRKASFTP